MFSRAGLLAVILLSKEPITEVTYETSASLVKALAEVREGRVKHIPVVTYHLSTYVMWKLRGWNQLTVKLLTVGTFLL